MSYVHFFHKLRAGLGIKIGFHASAVWVLTLPSVLVTPFKIDPQGSLLSYVYAA